MAREELPVSLNDEMKNDNRLVASWLLLYHERKSNYELSRESILHSSPSPPDGMPRGFETSDPTENKGGRLADLREDERWLVLVEEVEKRLPWKMQILLRLKQKHRVGTRGRPVRWIIALELSEEVSRRTKKDYSIGPDSIDEWWNRLVEYGARLAGKRGLL